MIYPTGRTPGPGATGYKANQNFYAWENGKSPNGNVTKSGITEAPSAGMSLKDLTKWMQDRGILGFHNADQNWAASGEAAQKARTDALNNYSTAVGGYQGLIGDLTNQVRQGSSQYGKTAGTAQNWLTQARDNLANGYVNPAERQRLQDIYDNQMAGVQSNLNKSFGVQQRKLMDDMASRGVLNSSIAANSLAQMEGEKQRQISNAANTFGAQMGQQLYESPYRQMTAQQGAANSLGSLASQYFSGQMAGANSQAQMGSSIPKMVAPTFDMAGKMMEIPDLVRSGYLAPLQSLWDQLLQSSTSLESSRIAADARNDVSDSDWLTGVGSIVGAIGGLF